MNEPLKEAAPPKMPDELVWLDHASSLLDNRFRIPGTNIRFGLDFLIGLIPYAGDIFSFGLSALLLIAMVRRGASGMVMLKMSGNILLDTLVGSIPILGDIFDLKYKSNVRNMRLLQEHYRYGKHGGSAWGPILLVICIIFAMLFLLLFLCWKIVQWGFNYE
ncbi:MAG: DUF4112 domain-containing protein [Saprospiraceae bacterium]|nr:DUF4112 domain-containing protein [Saprospiraceae bacterium]